MLAQNATRIKLLKIWELLCRETDEGHPMESTTIIEKLNNMGIPCDRKTLYRDIHVLCDCGYEVLCQRGRKNAYYVMDRSFDLPELHILLDAVQAASFITSKKTSEFIDKIAALGGSARAELLKKNIVEFNTTKHTNETIYYSIDKIDEAIVDGKKIIYRYFDYDANGNRVYRREGHRYVANPITLVFSNDNYYLICYHDNHPTLTNYRIDRMTDVDVLDSLINVEACPHNIDISDYRKQAFFMFSGETISVTIEMSAELIDVVFDKFGEGTKVNDLGNGKIQFSVDIQESNMFYGWCCSFGEKLEIVSPSKVRNRFIDYLKVIDRNYSM